jgi:hypothetical protein
MNNDELIQYFQKYYDQLKDYPDPYSEEGSTVYDYSGSNVDDAFDLGYNLGKARAFKEIIQKLTPKSE